MRRTMLKCSVFALLVIHGISVAEVEGQIVDLPDLDRIGYTLGDRDAPVTVVEFGDFACSACADFHRDTWPRLKRDLIDTGRVRWRHVPFDIGFDRSEESANAGECAADQGDFWRMHDRLFSRQRDWIRERRPQHIFFEYAEDLGLDLEAFEKCYEDEDGESRSRRATRVARDVGVRGTPTFFINGRQAVGALPFDMFLSLIEEAEAKIGG